jgi:hypothetical protein
MSAPAHWQCPTCKVEVATPYCAACGEQRLRPRDLRLSGLLAQIAQSMSSVDGRLLRTLRSLLAVPGELTVAYLQGRRKPFIAPFPFFLIVNVAFFAVQSLSGNAIFSTPLDSHLHLQDWSGLAQRLVDQRLQVLGTTLAAYTPLFDQAVQVNAKSLVILMTLPFAALLALLFHRGDRPLVTHLVFSLLFYAFLMAWLCVLLGVLFLLTRLAGLGLRSHAVDWGLFASLLGATAIYLYLAIGRGYGEKGLGRAIKVLVLTAAVGVGILGYRFTVFLITLYWS